MGVICDVKLEMLGIISVNWILLVIVISDFKKLFSFERQGFSV